MITVPCCAWAAATRRAPCWATAAPFLNGRRIFRVWARCTAPWRTWKTRWGIGKRRCAFRRRHYATNTRPTTRNLAPSATTTWAIIGNATARPPRASSPIGWLMPLFVYKPNLAALHKLYVTLPILTCRPRRRHLTRWQRRWSRSLACGSASFLPACRKPSPLGTRPLPPCGSLCSRKKPNGNGFNLLSHRRCRLSFWLPWNQEMKRKQWNYSRPSHQSSSRR